MTFGHQPPDGKPGFYYVTARNHNGKIALLLGPFIQRKPGTTAHQQALGAVNSARRAAIRLFPAETSFCEWGTMRADLDAWDGNPPEGKLGRRRVTLEVPA